MDSFKFSRSPEIYFGVGTVRQLAAIASGFGKNILLVTGERSFQKIGGSNILEELEKGGLSVSVVSNHGEPSPEFVDHVCKSYRNSKIELIIAIGGGSTIDAGKAISAMINMEKQVINYLEGVGNGDIHPGTKTPFIACPTTAGTGSEATKNAVLSKPGKNGFKKSLRHNSFIPDIALVDPELSKYQPKEVTAACGMDALTQLIESYVSTNASPITDSLAIEGIGLAFQGLPEAFRDSQNIRARSQLAYAALISGLTLANAGLGTVHGFASAIGGLFEIPHGIVCGTLVGSCIKTSIAKLSAMEPGNPQRENALRKYAAAGKLVSNSGNKNKHYYCNALADEISRMTNEMNIPKLGHFGITLDDIDKIIELSGNKNNPVKLDREDMREILTERL